MSEDALWGIKNGDTKIVQEMLEKGGIDVKAGLQNGRTALHFAADYGQVEVIKMLLEHGADINQKDEYGITPLLNAIFEGHEAAVKLLLSKGANKNGVAPDGQTYLECADTDDIKMLLK